MGCSCDKNINCDNGTQCTCGIVVKFINSETGVVAEQLNGTGYTEVNTGDLIYQIQQSPSLFNPGLLNIIYDESRELWIMQYRNPDTSDEPLNIATYDSDAMCPDSDCWEPDCGWYEFSWSGSSDYDFSWQGLYSPAPYSHMKAYFFSGPSPGLPEFQGGWYLWYGENDAANLEGIVSAAPRWILAQTSYTAEELQENPQYLTNSTQYPRIEVYGYLESPFTQCADGIFVNYNPGGEAPPRIELIRNNPLEGYDVVVERVECGCCDEEVSITIITNDETENTFTASVSVDEHGNVLGHNGYQYYTFNDGTEDLFIYFNGVSWSVGRYLDGREEIFSSTFDGDCPYAFYTSVPNTSHGGGITIIQIKGVECFDCCDYYTPRFTNFIRKQRAILVDETSYIRSKEVFGLQCGGDWQDILRKHLIIDTLSCLPYGVLCEEQEECLIENLSKNCNC